MLFLKDKMANFPQKKRAVVIVGSILLLIKFRKHFPKYFDTLIRVVPHFDEDLRRKPVKLDSVFVYRFIYILRMSFPSILCREMFVFILLTAALLLRTYFTLAISELIASSVKILVDQSFQAIGMKIFLFQVSFSPISFMAFCRLFFSGYSPTVDPSIWKRYFL